MKMAVEDFRCSSCASLLEISFLLAIHFQEHGCMLVHFLICSIVCDSLLMHSVWRCNPPLHSLNTLYFSMYSDDLCIYDQRDYVYLKQDCPRLRASLYHEGFE